MRLILSQDEIFEAIGGYLRTKMVLDASAKIEIGLTAGRGPKGYTADVEITYPKSDMAVQITAAPDAESGVWPTGDEQAADTTTSAPADVAAPGLASADNIFG